MEKFSRIFGITLLIFLENLVIFVEVVGRGGNVRKCWKFLEYFKDNFWKNLRSTLCMFVERISENEYVLEEA